MFEVINTKDAQDRKTMEFKTKVIKTTPTHQGYSFAIWIKTLSSIRKNTASSSYRLTPLIHTYISLQGFQTPMEPYHFWIP